MLLVQPAMSPRQLIESSSDSTIDSRSGAIPTWNTHGLGNRRVKRRHYSSCRPWDHSMDIKTHPRTASKTNIRREWEPCFNVRNPLTLFLQQDEPWRRITQPPDREPLTVRTVRRRDRSTDRVKQAVLSYHQPSHHSAPLN